MHNRADNCKRAISRRVFFPVLVLLVIAACRQDRQAGTPAATRHVYTVPIGLQLEDFQTPDDKELTGKVNDYIETWGMRKVIDLYYGQWKDKLTINHNNLRKLRVNKNQYNWLHAIVSQASAALGIVTPVIYLVQDPTPNAYITNVTDPILVIHSGLVDLLSREELLFVIGHELGHIKSGHVLTKELASTVLSAFSQIPFLDNLAPLLFLHWSRESETSADRLGLLLVQNEVVCSRALIRLVAGLTDKEGEINVEEFMRQKAEVEADNFALRRIPELLAEANMTHPFIGTRVTRLFEFKKSEQFAKILRDKKTTTIEIR